MYLLSIALGNVGAKERVSQVKRRKFAEHYAAGETMAGRVYHTQAESSYQATAYLNRALRFE